MVPSKIRSRLCEDLIPIQTTPDGINLYTHGRVSQNWVDFLYKNEPEMQEWINGFEPESVFWDIGAGIVYYSIYAALRGHTVFAFEPEPSNFYLLSQNIRLNNADVIALPVALNDETCIGPLYKMKSVTIGSDHNCFGRLLDAHGRRFIPKSHDSAIGMTMDTLSRKLLLEPNYVKIDVDGNEDKIISWGIATLSQVKSLMMECYRDRPDYNMIIAMVEGVGFSLNNFYEKTGNNIFMKIVTD